MIDESKGLDYVPVEDTSDEGIFQRGVTHRGPVKGRVMEALYYPTKNPGQHQLVVTFVVTESLYPEDIGATERYTQTTPHTKDNPKYKVSARAWNTMKSHFGLLGSEVRGSALRWKEFHFGVEELYDNSGPTTRYSRVITLSNGDYARIKAAAQQKATVEANQVSQLEALQASHTKPNPTDLPF